MYELSAPQGFVYNKQLPSLGSILSQAQQMRVMAQRYAQERAKIAEQRAYDTTKDLYKFNANPAIEAFRPYMQNRTNELMGMAEKVRSGQLDPLELQKAMAMTQNELDHIAKGDKELKAQMDVYAKNGNRNSDAILKIVSDNTYSFIDTEINNGEPVTVPPLMWGPKYIIDKVDSTSDTYNGKAMSQKFVDYVKTNFTAGETVGAEGSPIAGTFTQVKTSGLPLNKYLGKLNDKGNYVVNVGLNDDGSNSDQTNELIGIWKANGKDYANYLELVAKERGVSEGKALQQIMVESGHIAPKIERDLRVAPDNTDKAGTAFNSNFIGGSRKDEYTAMQGADFVKRLFDPNTRSGALSSFKSPRIKSASIANNILSIELTSNGVNDAISMGQMMLAGAKSEEDKTNAEDFLKSISPESKSAKIILTPDNIGELINWVNVAQEGKNWMGPLVKEAFDKKYGQPVEAGETIYDLSTAPTPADAQEFIIKAPIGTKYKLNGRVYTKKK